MSSQKAGYRKHNDGSHNSSTYHKKDGTPIRNILKEEAKKEIKEDCFTCQGCGWCDPVNRDICWECKGTGNNEVR